MWKTAGNTEITDVSPPATHIFIHGAVALRVPAWRLPSAAAKFSICGDHNFCLPFVKHRDVNSFQLLISIIAEKRSAALRRKRDEQRSADFFYERAPVRARAHLRPYGIPETGFAKCAASIIYIYIRLRCVSSRRKGKTLRLIWGELYCAGSMVSRLKIMKRNGKIARVEDQSKGERNIFIKRYIRSKSMQDESYTIS